MAHKKWQFRAGDKELAAALSEKLNINELLAYLLVSRGLKTELAISGFLSDSYEMVSPFHFADMEEAVFAIGDAIDNGEKICIYGDYDCDGVTATALLLQFLQNEGADVFYYIPSREDGYGLHCAAIDTIKAQGASLIVTVDNGISALDEADYIYQCGMRLVVTDHHQLAERLPRAEAVVNPHRAENELTFRDYCGVGVAFKLICAMYDGDVNDLMEAYIDLVAIGTIADVMPLVEENRAFVKAGLHRINTAPRISLATFIRSNGEKVYTANDIAFQLCPRLNAMGRMGDAARAVEFLISQEEADCAFKCEQLNLENAQRQETERSILEDALRQIDAQPRLAQMRVIVVAGKGYHHGVIGIVASSLAERFAKPALVIGIDENGVAVGSARSIEGFNIYEAIDACKDDLMKFGGHPLAAGITLHADNIDAFRTHINAYALEAYEEMPFPVLEVDCRVSPHYLSLELVDALSVLEPYGAQNPPAVFGVNRLLIKNITPLSEGRHVRLTLEKKGKQIQVVQFGTAYDTFPYQVGDCVNIAVRISKNFFREKHYLSIQAVDICLHGTDDDKYFHEKHDYEMYCLLKTPVESLYPTREICAVLYKYLKARGQCSGFDAVYFHLQPQLTYGAMMLALKAFVQAGLIQIEGETVFCVQAPGKVNLEETSVLKILKERLGIV